MIKKDLEKLRTLNATPKMIEIANEDGREINKYLEIKNKFKCKYLMRCQQLNGFIKVALFTAEDIRNGEKRPKFEVFLNYQGDEYLSRERQKNGTWKWRTAMIENLVDWSWWYNRDCDELCWLNPEGKNTIRNILKTKETGFKGIQEWQKKCKTRHEDKKIKVKVKAWDEAMKPINAPPKGFEEWWKHDGFDGENYIYYKYSRKITQGYCTACQKYVTIEHQPKHLEEGWCEVCKKKVTYISRGKKKSTIWTSYRGVTCIQKYGSGIVVRNFSLRRADSSTELNVNESTYMACETKRIIMQNGVMESYEWYDYRRRGMRWTKQEAPTISRIHEKVFEKNLRTVLKGIHSSYLIAKKAGYKAAGLTYFIYKEMRYPIIERVFKAGLVKLGLDFMYCEISQIKLNSEANELSKQLGIDNARMKRLKELGEDIATLEWLQEEKKLNTQFNDACIQVMAAGKIKASNATIIELQKYISLTKICNYVKKQIKLRSQAIGERNIRETLRDWLDYIDMMKKNNMDCSKEILIKPRDLKIAHNELVSRMEMKNSKKEIAKIKKKFPNAQKICKDYELKKYELVGEKYCIRVPRDIKEIFEEGIILKHCIHTCDIYFNRMENRETYLIFLRRTEEPDKPWYTLEIEPGGNIRQKKSVLNEAYKDLDDAMSFIKEWQQCVKNNLTEEDKKLAEMSDEARKKGYKQLREEKKVIWHGRMQGQLLADALEQDFMEAVM